MDDVLEMLMGMVATKPINVTVNVYNRPDSTLVSQGLTTLKSSGSCELCESCAEDFDEVIDCDDCEDAKYAEIWETFKGIIQAIPNSALKVEILGLMENVKNSILG